MNKLTLDVDELRVDSFEIPRHVREKGTVEAHWAWSDNSICPTTAPSDARPCL
ncbi:MAG TPA: hypothetical protein VFJ82_06675 [Longimicrobium sp.]|nr:hypothetical protein [Longimicrobium sp.]